MYFLAEKWLFDNYNIKNFQLNIALTAAQRYNKEMT
jgi:hypothetical protein